MELGGSEYGPFSSLVRGKSHSAVCASPAAVVFVRARVHVCIVKDGRVAVVLAQLLHHFQLFFSFFFAPCLIHFGFFLRFFFL